MANWYEPTEEQQELWRQWLAGRPEAVRKVAEQFPPWGLYRLESSGHRVTIYSLQEGKDDSVTLVVNVLGKFNYVAFERRVFGIHPEELTPCELPADDELLGDAGMDPQEAVRQMRDREPTVH